jgi:hypothetical protein
VTVMPRHGPLTPDRYRATHAAATNKLLQAAEFELPHAGWWEFAVDVYDGHKASCLRFALEASDPPPTWRALWPWYCWPLLVVAIFILISRARLNSRAPLSDAE